MHCNVMYLKNVDKLTICWILAGSHKNIDHKSGKKKRIRKIIRRFKKAEQINITKQAEHFIMNICNNSIRLLINYLEKFNFYLYVLIQASRKILI